MKTLYFDCGMGAAGDMLTAALLDLLTDEEQKRFLEELEALEIPGVKYELTDAEKCGIHGKHMKVTVHGEEEVSEDVSVSEKVVDGHDHDHHHHDDYDHEHHHHNHEDHEHEHHHDDHDHEHHHHDEHNHEHHHHDDHDHEHHHHDDDHHEHQEHDYEHHHHDHEHHHGPHEHHSLQDIQTVVDGLAVSAKVKADVIGVYRLIAEAEAKAHNKEITQIHFHEVGNMDAVADVTAVCLLIEKLAPEKICASPIHVGSGHVRCAHGILPVPAPATAYILQGVPSYGGEIQGELCTPTGAALLKYFVNEFGGMPVMSTERIGYGMGYKDFKFANCIRVFVGEIDVTNVVAENAGRDEASSHRGLAYETGNDEETATEYICELSCNLDDMTGEEIGFAMEQILARGALDVYTQAIGMKKNRPGIKLSVICHEEDSETYAALLLKYTTTLGVREERFKRYTLKRREEVFKTDLGEIREKISYGYGVAKKKTEYEDLRKIALENDLSLREALEVSVVQKTNL